MKSTDYQGGERSAGSDKRNKPDAGGDPLQQAREWGGGSKGSKGPVTAADRKNEQSSAKR